MLTGGYDTATLTLGDLDGDEDLDLFTTGNLTENRVPTALRFNKVWLNDGTGTLRDSDQWLPHLPFSRIADPADAAVTVADIDQDGDLDGITITRFTLVV